MKTSFASTLAFLPILPIISAFEISSIYKNTLGSCDCKDIRLTEGHVLRATCFDPEKRRVADFDLDLNSCLANYLGTLNHVTGNGNFAASCTDCGMNGTKLMCDCSTGVDGGTIHNVMELNDWKVIQVKYSHFTCDDTRGIEKRPLMAGPNYFRA